MALEQCGVTSYEGVFTSLQKAMFGSTDLFFDKAVDLIQNIAPFFSLAFGIYLIIVFWGYSNTGFNEGVVDFSKRMLGWILIIIFAFNANTYKTNAKALAELPEALGAAVSNKQVNGNMLDCYWANTEQKILKISDATSEIKVEQVAKALTANLLLGWTQLCVVLFLAFLFIFYMLAKLSLLLVLLVGPLFLGFLLYPSTRQWGINWINQVMNFSVTVMLYIGLLIIQQNVYETILYDAFAKFDITPTGLRGMATGAIDGSLVVEFLWKAFVPITGCTLLCIIITFSVPSIASALTGGNGVGISSHTGKSAGKGLIKIGKDIATKGKSLFSGGSIKG